MEGAEALDEIVKREDLRPKSCESADGHEHAEEASHLQHHAHRAHGTV
jgi:hypothetical protein